MDWYVVVKTINGRRYRYRQKTWRENGKVRTSSHYLGPADDDRPASTGRIHAKPFDEAIADRVISVLADERNRTVSWEPGWSRRRPHDAEGQAGRLPIVDRLVSALKVDRGTAWRAFYNPGADKLRLPPRRAFYDITGEEATYVYYSTLCHELIHWTGHESRLDRLTDALWSEAGYAQEELIAEAGSLMLMEHLGIAPEKATIHVAYFQDWLKRVPDKEQALARARRDAEQAVRYILENGFNTRR